LLLNIIRIILIILFLLIGIEYLTIIECKILRYVQFRKGPNKIGFLRLLQPFKDGFKLLNKRGEGNLIYKANYLIYYICPIILIIFIILF